MNEEMLQNDDLEAENVDLQDDEAAELETEQANESEEVAPKAVDDFVELDPIQQKKFNKLTWEKNEKAREVEALQKRIAELEAKQTPKEEAAVQAQNVEMPDDDLLYSDPEAYKAQAQKYQQAILEEAKRTAQEAAKSTLEAQKTEAQKAAEEAQVRQRVEGFTSRAIESGIKAEDLIEAENIVAAYQPSADVANFILEDDKGPQLMHYLAQNQQELAEIVQMSPMRAALKLNDLKAKALTKKATSAPDPIETVSSRGVVKEEPAHVRGATFE